jgi:hypothetical protein
MEQVELRFYKHLKTISKSLLPCLSDSAKNCNSIGARSSN